MTTGRKDHDGSGALLSHLRDIVGVRHVLTRESDTRRFRTGYRFGTGTALAVVRPGSLVEMWRILRACAAADAIVIVQAANTGLTGGSTPDGDDYDRVVVVVNTLRIDGIFPVRQGRQVVCLAGATLYGLEQALAPLDRSPHSVIGSSCIGASVVGGVCNNSGGSLLQRGPAFTELALYAVVGADGRVDLVDHLGLSLGDEPEEVLARLDQGRFTDADVRDDPHRRGSDGDYHDHVRRIDEPGPARFNADPRRLSGASGSAGKAMVMAVRLDTFARERQRAVLYVGTNDPAELGAIRRDMLSSFRHLPVEAEYLHRDAFDMAAVYGRDMMATLAWLGTRRLPLIAAAKARVDAICARVPFLPRHPSDRLLQRSSRFLPDLVPPRLRAFRDRYEHHLMLRVADDGIEEARAYLASRFPSAMGDVILCTPEEGDRAFQLRFVTAGAAVRYRAVHAGSVEDIVALDVALPRNAREWRERLPAELDAKLSHRLYYGHFFCHVFHHDYIVKRGEDAHAIEAALCRLMDERGAEYPAEHNVGHLYPAKRALTDHYRSLDPTNSFNPGIGKTSRRRNWC